MRRLRAGAVGLVVGALAGCSLVGDAMPGGGSDGGEGADASEVAEDLKGAAPTATKIVVVTEDNDPNDLIGRPNGYDSAAIIYDSEASCEELGTDCGVGIEVFSDEEGAQARAQYLQEILKESPVFGSEWDYVRGPVLVRVSGNLKPSVAENYADAFDGEEVTVDD